MATLDNLKFNTNVEVEGGLSVGEDITINGESLKEKIEENSVGQKVADGGEVFNDYENNQALSEFSHTEGYKSRSGAKVFSLDEAYYANTANDFTADKIGGDNNEGWYHLNSVEGLAEILATKKPTYTVLLTNNYDFNGTIEEVDTTNKKIKVTNFLLPNEINASTGKLITGQKLRTVAEFGIDRSYIMLVDHTDAGDVTTGDYTHAEGDNTIAAARAAHAEGRDTKAVGKHSHTEGKGTYAAYCAHAEGQNAKAIGDSSHAEGSGTVASAAMAHAEGQGTTASGVTSHAEGIKTKATGQYSHTEGNQTEAIADSAHAEGKLTKATGVATHAEGQGTKATASCSHAEGISTEASGETSHAEGKSTKATELCAHAEGFGTIASGQYSHAEGHKTKASGGLSHVGGLLSESSGNRSFAHGSYLKATKDNQAVFGIANEEDSDALLIVGNGSGSTWNWNENGDVADKRQNAFTVKKDGRATVSKNPTNPMDVATLGTVNSAKEEVISALNTHKTESDKTYLHKTPSKAEVVYAHLKDSKTNEFYEGVLRISGGVYYQDSDGTYKVSKWTLPQRNGIGSITVPTPVSDTDVANKKYVDDKLSQVAETTGGRLIELVNPIIDTDRTGPALLDIFVNDIYINKLWEHVPDGPVSPTAPETISGVFINMSELLSFDNGTADVEFGFTSNNEYWPNGNIKIHFIDGREIILNKDNKTCISSPPDLSEATIELAFEVRSETSGDIVTDAVLSAYPKFVAKQAGRAETHTYDIELSNMTEYRIVKADFTHGCVNNNVNINVICNTNVSIDKLFESNINFASEDGVLTNVTFKNSSAANFHKTYSDDELKRINMLKIENPGVFDKELLVTLRSYD